VVFGSLVERQLVTDLNLTERLATWTDASTGASRTEPIEIISWIQWRPVGASKTFDLLLGAAVGLLVGAAGGMSATAILGRDTCVGGTALGRPGVGYFAERCFPGWTNQLPLWGAVGAAIGAFVGGVVGWAVGRETRLEFNDARVP
jgi:hypothetical protein